MVVNLQPFVSERDNERALHARNLSATPIIAILLATALVRDFCRHSMDTDCREMVVTIIMCLVICKLFWLISRSLRKF